MSTPILNHRLSSVDSTFLYFEKKEAPMHIGSVSLFEGEMPFEDFVQMVDAKIHLLPRYQQVVTPDPFNLGHPTWEHDHRFNVRNHIFKVQIDAPGTEEQLIELAGKIFTPMMDRTKPLWDIFWVYGLKGGNCAMIARVHHAMVDGMSGVELLKIILDISKIPPPIPPKPEAKPKPIAVDPTRRFFDTILGSMNEGMNRWMDFQNGLLNLSQALVNETSRAAMSNISSEIPKLASPANPLPFNRACSGDRKLVWNTFNFAEARAIRGALGGTVNDVVLTTLSGAVSRYAQSHNLSVAGRNLRVMVPVSMRQEDQRTALGNVVSMLPVEIPLDIQDAVERFKYVNAKTAAMKGGKIAEGLNLGLALMGILPAPVQALMGALAPSNLPLPVYNIVSTNVPGPQVPLYAMGHRMTAYYPYVPVGYAVGCGCAIMSYDQHLYFGLTADTNAMPDVEKLRECLYESFYELRKVAGVEEIKPQVMKSKAAAAGKTTVKAKATRVARNKK